MGLYLLEGFKINIIFLTTLRRTTFFLSLYKAEILQVSAVSERQSLLCRLFDNIHMRPH